MANEISIGKKISEGRKSNNLSQAQLAEMLAITPQAISKWERGESMPDIITLDKIAQILNKDIKYFVRDEVNDEPSIEIEKENEEQKAKVRWNFSSDSWKDADFSNLKGINGKFSFANIDSCNFTNSDFSSTTLKANNIKSSDFTNADLSDCAFYLSNINRNNFSNCNLTNTEFSGSNLAHNNFNEADLTNTTIKGSTFIKNSMQNAKLNNTHFKTTALKNIVISGEVKDSSFVQCMMINVEFSEVNFTNTFFKKQNLKKVVFKNCYADKLTYSFLVHSKANMQGITLKEQE